MNDQGHGVPDISRCSTVPPIARVMEPDPPPSPPVGWALKNDLPPGYEEWEHPAPAFDEGQFMTSLPRLDRLVFKRPLRRILSAKSDSSVRKRVDRWVANYGLLSAALTVAARLWLLVAAQFGMLFVLDLVIMRGRLDPISITLFVLAMTCVAMGFVHSVAAWSTGRRPR